MEDNQLKRELANARQSLHDEQWRAMNVESELREELRSAVFWLDTAEALLRKLGKECHAADQFDKWRAKPKGNKI
jgi:hypothetical protein